jgi:hypothetical protein
MEWFSPAVYKKYKILKQKQQSTYADGLLMQVEQKMRLIESRIDILLLDRVF